MKTTKKRKATKTVKQTEPRPSALQTVMEPGETRDQALARSDLNPETLAAFTWLHLHPLFSSGELSMMGMTDALRKQSLAVIDGDMSCAEEMLVMQAYTLNGLFNILTQKAVRNFGDYLDTAEAYLKLGFRAQSLCRSTLETLSEIKHPTIFAKQANIAHNQQINNGMPDPSRAREIKNPPNKLLEKNDGQRLDTTTTSTTGTANQVMETVGEVHRSADR